MCLPSYRNKTFSPQISQELLEALVLAMLDGHHALYKGGKRLEGRGMVALLQPG